jgi:hypothetical protein
MKQLLLLVKQMQLPLIISLVAIFMFVFANVYLTVCDFFHLTQTWQQVTLFVSPLLGAACFTGWYERRERRERRARRRSPAPSKPDEEIKIK